MAGITRKNDLISYYGNPAGYIVSGGSTEKGSAIVDSNFKNEEFSNWLSSHALTPSWTDGVMERLHASEQLGGVESAAPLKNVRIWQLKPDTDVRMKFIGYEEAVKSFGNPNPADYQIAYDGQMGTNDLEEIYTRCNIDHPPGYHGHSLSMSDVVELYDANVNDDGMSSSFHYCDRFGFQEISFEENSQTQGMEQSMSQSF